MANATSYVKPPKSQRIWIRGLKEYVENHFGKFSFDELRYIIPNTPVYDSIVKMQRDRGKLQEKDELGGCCGILPTGEVVIYLVNKHKRGHKLPLYGLLFEMIHLAKPDWSSERVEQEADKHLDHATEYSEIFAYNTTHKHKKKMYAK